MNPTHDWHVADGMELLISRDEVDSVSVRLGHENMDDAHGTLIITSRLLEMIDTVQPGAVRAYLGEQEPARPALHITHTSPPAPQQVPVRMPCPRCGLR